MGCPGFVNFLLKLMKIYALKASCNFCFYVFLVLLTSRSEFRNWEIKLFSFSKLDYFALNTPHRIDNAAIIDAVVIYS